jgi:hypothetical protein
MIIAFGRKMSFVKIALTKTFVSLSFLLSVSVYADSTSVPGVYIFEAGQDLVNLYSMPGTTNLNAGDDQVSSWSPDFGFNFSIFGNTYRNAKMSTNGCVNFIGNKCSDFTPQPLPYIDKTLYPFWTDLIRGTASGGQTSKMLYKSFDDYVVFGWYYMREYNRSSSNSFEAILYANDTYEYRYRELDIIEHNVLIGEQNTSTDHKTYRFYDDNTGGHDTWDSYDASFGSSKLEDGGSLYSGSFTDMCSNNQLYSSSCTGYSAAYQTQQCGISALYSTSCSGYGTAYLAQQCGINALYDTGCSGYAAAYFTQECTINALYDTDCTGYAAAEYTYQCNRDVLYDSGCPGYWEEIAYQNSLIVIAVELDSTDSIDNYGYSDGSSSIDEFGNTTENSFGYEDPILTQNDFGYDEEYDTNSEDFGYDVEYDTNSDTNYEEFGDTDENLYGYNDEGVAYTQDDLWYDEEYDEYLDPNDPCYENGCDGYTDADWYELDVEQFGQTQVDEWYGEEVAFSDEGSVVWEEESHIIAEEFWANIDTSMDAYDLEMDIIMATDIYYEEEEIFYEEEIFLLEDLFYEEEVFNEPEYEEIQELEEIFFEERFLEEIQEEEQFLEETYPEIEAEMLAQVLLDDIDVYILQEETGLELLREEDWEPEEVLELYENTLEDFERDALEELEEEIYEEFLEEIDEEVLEELVDEETLEELIDEEDLEDEKEEEFFEEAEEKEEEVEERRESISRRVISRVKVGENTPTQIATAPSSIVSARATAIVSSSSQVSSTSSGVSTSQSVSQNSGGQQFSGSSSQQSSGQQVQQQQSNGQQVQQQQQQVVQQQSSGQQQQQQQVVQQQSSGSQQQQQQVQQQQSQGSGQQQQVAQQQIQSSGQQIQIQSFGQVQQVEQVEQQQQATGAPIPQQIVEESITQQIVLDNTIQQQEYINETQDFSSPSDNTTMVINTFDSIGDISVAQEVFSMIEPEIEDTVELSNTFAEVSVEFEQTFNDALGVGQSIGQFLSNEVPNFTRFNVEPPTVQEQQVTTAVESLADRVGTEQAEANLQAQFESMEETGGFGDQTVAVAFIGYAPGFSAYTAQTQLADRAGWYQSTQLPSPDVVDNNFSFYMMAGNADKKLAAMRR